MYKNTSWLLYSCAVLYTVHHTAMYQIVVERARPHSVLDCARDAMYCFVLCTRYNVMFCTVSLEIKFSVFTFTQNVMMRLLNKMLNSIKVCIFWYALCLLYCVKFGMVKASGLYQP